MATMTNKFAAEPTSFGYRFFSRPLLHSVSFFALLAIQSVSIGFSAYLMIGNWARLPSHLASQLFLGIFGGVIAPLYWTVSFRGRIHELFLLGKLQADRPEESHKTVLDVTATVILTGFFITSTSVFLLVLVVARLVSLLHGRDL